MSTQLTVTVPANEKGAELLRRMARVIENIEMGDGKEDDSDAPTPVKRGRKPKAKVEEQEEETGGDDDGLGDEDGGNDDDGFGLGDDEEEAEEKPAKKSALSLDKDVIPAFQKFAKKHSKEAAFKILKKYGVKAVRDLPATKYTEVLKLLKA